MTRIPILFTKYYKRSQLNTVMIKPMRIIGRRNKLFFS